MPILRLFFIVRWDQISACCGPPSVECHFAVVQGVIRRRAPDRLKNIPCLQKQLYMQGITLALLVAYFEKSCLPVLD
jgi:hypothetical protein